MLQNRFVLECSVNDHCPKNSACSNSSEGKCIDPCRLTEGLCCSDKSCATKNHVPTCIGILRMISLK